MIEAASPPRPRGLTAIARRVRIPPLKQAGSWSGKRFALTGVALQQVHEPNYAAILPSVIPMPTMELTRRVILRMTDEQIVNLIEQLPIERQQSVVKALLMKRESNPRWKRMFALMDEVGARNADKPEDGV